MNEGHNRELSFNGMYDNQVTAVVKHVQIDLQTES